MRNTLRDLAKDPKRGVREAEVDAEARWRDS